MTRMKLVLLILNTSLLLGCDQEKTQVQIKEISLKGVELKVNTILNPTRVTVFDSILIVNEPRRTNKGIKLISLNNFKLISNAVCLGKGPGELSNPANMVFDKKNRLLWYSDWGKNKCFKFPIDSLVLNPDFKPKESFVLKKELVPMLNMFLHQSGNIGYTSFNLQKNLINFIDTRGEQLETIAIPNKIFKNLWEDIGISDNPIDIHYSSDKEMIIVTSRFTDNIALIDEKGIPKFQIDKLGIKTDQKRQTISGSHYRSFYQIDSDERFIYCLYVGGDILGYDKELNKNVVNYPNRLLVFSWEGLVKYDIELDQPLLSFSLDKKRKRIIGSTQNFDNGLVFYDLSKLY